MQNTEISGQVTDVIFKNEDNGYAVVRIENDTDEFIAVGTLFGINEGENVTITGSWTEHPSYGEQFKVEMYEKRMPTTAEEIERYLSSGIIKGVRGATAKKIVEKFGEESLNVISESPEKVAEISGISLAKACLITKNFNENLGTSELFMFLHKYGISSNVCMKIYRKHKLLSKKAVLANPYLLCDADYGISFKKADEIAAENGILPDDENRVCAGVIYALRWALQYGHTFLPYDILSNTCSQIVGIPTERLGPYIDYLCTVMSCKCEEKNGEKNIYLYEYYEYEQYVSQKLAALCKKQYELDDINIDKQIDIVEGKNSIHFAALQREAIKCAMQKSVMVITGGPGTGKTTIINAIIDMMESIGMKVVLTAPTGRAAKRMSQVCSMEAKTIHRLLEVSFSESDDINCIHDESDPIDADVIIVDEMSMVDIVLMDSLLHAARPGTRLVLVGDVNQLPSVGAGNVLHDIISSSAVSVIKLNEIFRQAQKSMIVKNAHAINSGEYPMCNSEDTDFYFASVDNPDFGARYICELCHDRLKDKYGFDSFDIQVLSPTKKGITGTVRLNDALQKLLNPASPSKKEKKYGDIIFREGDKVMQIKNNYNIEWKDTTTDAPGMGIFNGDVGYIEEINDDFRTVTVIYDDKRVVYEQKDLAELSLAYCITVHKSQGSEFPVVIMPMYPAPGMLLNRNLFYTGVTRARKLVVLVGRNSIIEKMVNNNHEDKRYSGLTEKLYNEFYG